MNNYPRVDNPLIILLKGHVPSLKNRPDVRIKAVWREDKKSREVWLPGNRINCSKLPNRPVKLVSLRFPNKDARKFIQKVSGEIRKQMENQSLDQILKPTQVATVTRVGLKSVGELPNQDLDNAYQTVQEAMQHVIIENDRQVTAAIQDTIIVPQKELEFLQCAIWVPENETSKVAEGLIVYEMMKQQVTADTTENITDFLKGL